MTMLGRNLLWVFTLLTAQSLNGQSPELPVFSDPDLRAVSEAQDRWFNKGVLKFSHDNGPLKNKKVDQLLEQLLMIASIGSEEGFKLFDDCYAAPDGAIPDSGPVSLTSYKVCLGSPHAITITLATPAASVLTFYNSRIDLTQEATGTWQTALADNLKGIRASADNVVIYTKTTTKWKITTGKGEKAKEFSWGLVLCWVKTDAKAFKLFGIVPASHFNMWSRQPDRWKNQPKKDLTPRIKEPAKRKTIQDASDGDYDDDGVIDGKDHCPYQKGTTKFGCPDVDGDGVPDDGWATDVLDLCPSISRDSMVVSLIGRDDKRALVLCPGMVRDSIGWIYGCPDQDHDNVPDTLELRTQKGNLGKIRKDECKCTTGTLASGCLPISKATVADSLNARVIELQSIFRSELTLSKDGRQLDSIDQRQLEALFWDGPKATIEVIKCDGKGKPQPAALGQYVSRLKKYKYDYIILEFPSALDSLRGYSVSADSSIATGYVEFVQDFIGEKPGKDEDYEDRTRKQLWIEGRRQQNGKFLYKLKAIRVVRCGRKPTSK